MASIRLEKLDKKYGSVHAVKEIDLDIADGEFMAFLGPSGCGKSSTMRCIAGLEEINGGKIYFGDRCVNRVFPKDRGVAMAFETYALYPTLNVYENLAFPLRAAKWKDDKIKEKVLDIAKILEITDLLYRMPRALSSGQAQRTGLARALIRQPEVFVLDEPISHLDTRQRGRMRAYLKRLHIELGYTMVYVTHDQEEAMAMADRITIMNDGVLVQTGTPEEVYHHPINTFVAGFIGEPSMNFLDCRIIKDNGKHYLVSIASDDVRTTLPETLIDFVERGKLPEEIIFGIRPYYVFISKEQGSGLPASVFVVEPLGDSNVITLNVANTQMQVVTAPNAFFNTNDKVWLSFDSERILVFDKMTGETLAHGKELI